MRKYSYLFAVTVAALTLTLSLNGCSVVNQAINDYSQGKEPCTLDTNDVTHFTYKDISYTILDTVETDENLGSWVGYLRQLAIVDSDGSVLSVQDSLNPDLVELSDSLDTNLNNVSAISYSNVYLYEDSDSEDTLLVHVNGQYHKAIQSDSLAKKDVILNVRDLTSNASTSFSISKSDCTQLIDGDGSVYQITEEIIEESELGDYLDVLAESITFDSDSHKKLSSKELSSIDWDGTGSSKQKRESWMYGTVYSIQGTDVKDAIAVEINHEYRLAKYVN